MTPQELLTSLDAVGRDAPLIFVTENGPINAGYHVTEVKLASVRSLDCAARRSDWTEAQIQLLDGRGQDYMTVGKFTGILRKATTELVGLLEAPVKFEFSHGNKGLHILEPGRPIMGSHEVSLPLGEVNAACKPAVEVALASTNTGCYGGAQKAPSSCC